VGGQERAKGIRQDIYRETFSSARSYTRNEVLNKKKVHSGILCEDNLTNEKKVGVKSNPNNRRGEQDFGSAK